MMWLIGPPPGIGEKNETSVTPCAIAGFATVPVASAAVPARNCLRSMMSSLLLCASCSVDATFRRQVEPLRGGGVPGEMHRLADLRGGAPGDSNQEGLASDPGLDQRVGSEVFDRRDGRGHALAPETHGLRPDADCEGRGIAAAGAP